MRTAASVEHESKELTFGRIFRRLPLYFGLALAGLVTVALLLTVSIHFRVTGYVTGAWIGFVGYSGLLFWVVVWQARSHWYRWAFWLVTLALMAAHCFVFVSILRVYPQWRMIWFWPIVVAEGGFIGATFEWIFPEKHVRNHRSEDL